MVVAWKDRYEGLRVQPSETQQTVHNGRSRAFVRRLHYALGRVQRGFPRVPFAVIAGKRNHYLLLRERELRSPQCLCQQCPPIEERAELLGTLVAADQF